jgi:hypothetical protein
VKRPKVLSLGGGLDSWAMLIDAELRGELPDVVAFVDVGDPDDRDGQPGEWDGTYRHIEEVVRPWCAARKIDFVEISARTGYMVREARSLFQWLWDRHQIPVAGPNRICTRIAKVERFEAWLDATYPGQEVEVWIGFDANEQARVDKDPNVGKSRGPVHLGKLASWWRWTRSLAYAMTHARRVNRFPLIERGLCRCRCEALARSSGYPVPRKSACQYCPYGSRGDWQRLAVDRPARFARVVEMEERKPPTVKNGRKLSIMAYNSKTQTGTPLPAFVRRPYTPKTVPCRTCGARNRATKAAGCGYLEAGTNEGGLMHAGKEGSV